VVPRYVRIRRRGAIGWMRQLVVTSCLADGCVRLWEETASYNRSMCVWQWRLVTSFSHATKGDYRSLLFILWEAATIHLPSSCIYFLNSCKLGCCFDINVVERRSCPASCQFLHLQGLHCGSVLIFSYIVINNMPLGIIVKRFAPSSSSFGFQRLTPL
jgi:hypothetical protein